jgi:hypothetical protein
VTNKSQHIVDDVSIPGDVIIVETQQVVADVVDDNTDDSMSSSKLVMPYNADSGGADILYDDWRTKWRRMRRGGTTVEW